MLDSSSGRRLQYGARCAALGNGSQPEASAPNNGSGAFGVDHPGGSIDVDVDSICGQDECPFPLHDAFSPERKDRTRLRNQVRV